MHPVTPAMTVCAMEYIDYLRCDCRINLNDYLDEAIMAEIYLRMRAARPKIVPAQLAQVFRGSEKE